MVGGGKRWNGYMVVVKKDRVLVVGGGDKKE